MQTNYPSSMPKGMPGMIADGRHKVVESWAAEEDIPFGRGVVAGTDPEKQVKLPTAAGDATEIFRGVAVHTHAVDRGTEPSGYPEKDAVGVLRRGVIWVEVSSAVAADADAYVDHVNEDGRFTDVATDNGAAVGKFRSAAAQDGLAILELNLP